MIQINQVSHCFGSTEVLKNINLDFTEKRIAILGANGSGKSTFIRLLNGLIIPQQGQVIVDDIASHNDVNTLRQKVGVVFQNPDNQIVYPVVSEDLAFGLKSLKLSKDEIEKRINNILVTYNITHLKDRFTHELSGGEKQLIAMCGVLIMQPKYMVFDEPTTLLDLRNKNQVRKMIYQLPQFVIMATHDLDLIDDFDRVIVFDNGEIVADNNPSIAIRFYQQLMQ